jgi:hypothetical protein
MPTSDLGPFIASLGGDAGQGADHEQFARQCPAINDVSTAHRVPSNDVSTALWLRATSR